MSISEELKNEVLDIFYDCDIRKSREVEANISFRTFLIANYSLKYIKKHFPCLWERYGFSETTQ